MTLILGIECPADDAAIVCADSGAWQGDLVATLRRPKLWRCNGWVMGLAGSWWHSQMAREVSIDAPPGGASCTFEDADECLRRYMLQLVEHLSERAEKLAKLDEDAKKILPGLVAAYRCWVWDGICGEAVSTTAGYTAAGCVDFGLAAMAALQFSRNGEPPQRMPEALMDLECATGAVRSISTSVQPPFRWMATNWSEGEF